MQKSHHRKIRCIRPLIEHSPCGIFEIMKIKAHATRQLLYKTDDKPLSIASLLSAIFINKK
jgi:hypothetical protein